MGDEICIKRAARTFGPSTITGLDTSLKMDCTALYTHPWTCFDIWFSYVCSKIMILIPDHESQVWRVSQAIGKWYRSASPKRASSMSDKHVLKVFKRRSKPRTQPIGWGDQYTWYYTRNSATTNMSDKCFALNIWLTQSWGSNTWQWLPVERKKSDSRCRQITNCRKMMISQQSLCGKLVIQLGHKPSYLRASNPGGHQVWYSHRDRVKVRKTIIIQ